MNFLQKEGFFQFSGFFSIFRPILPTEFDRAGIFTSDIYFGYLFGEFGAWYIKIKQTSQKRSKKQRKLEKFTEGTIFTLWG